MKTRMRSVYFELNLLLAVWVAALSAATGRSTIGRWERAWHV
jgi:hypothetical protein